MNECRQDQEIRSDFIHSFTSVLRVKSFRGGEEPKDPFVGWRRRPRPRIQSTRSWGIRLFLNINGFGFFGYIYRFVVGEKNRGIPHLIESRCFEYVCTVGKLQWMDGWMDRHPKNNLLLLLAPIVRHPFVS